jgi:hypothetical protein
MLTTRVEKTWSGRSLRYTDSDKSMKMFAAGSLGPYNRKQFYWPHLLISGSGPVLASINSALNFRIPKIHFDLRM